MTRLMRFLAVLALAGLAACTTTQNPIGVSAGPQADARLLGAWKGQMGDDKGEAYMFVLPRDVGMEALLVKVADKDDKGGWASVSVLPGKAGAYGFLNTRVLLDDGEAKKSDSEDFYPLLYRIDADGTLRLFLPDDDAVAKAVQTKRIAGDVNMSPSGSTNSVRLTADEATLDAYFATAAPELFTKPYGTMRRAR